mgnify:CR=1 FL=1
MNNPQIGACGACIAALLLAGATAFAEVKPPQPASMPPKPAQAHAQPRTHVHRGKASIYSRKLAHKPMADGSKLDLNSNAAASKQLPLGSKAVVTNLRNGRSAEVTIQDRGPYVDGRIIDLSPHTAAKLDMKSEGVVPVQVTPLPAKSPSSQEVAERQPR